MNSDLSHRFIDWAFANRRWPLLIPLSLPAAFRFLQQYHELTFKQTIWNPEFQSFSAVVLLLTVVLYLWISCRVWKLAVMALCIGIGILLSTIIWRFESRKAEVEPAKAARDAVEALMTRQDSSGGFRIKLPYQENLTNPLTTSQALVAVLFATLRI